MNIPPLLQEHVEELEKKRKLDIRITAASEIYIVLKNYQIPRSIWNRDRADILVITHPTYPNAKMDMFWVDPPISLKNGSSPGGVSPDSRCGREWQRFSWHVKDWSPAHDNLITYLDVVDYRLRQNR